MTISYSFHLSSKRHAVTDTNKVAEVSRHNLRQYMSEHYDKSKIEILRGSDKSILDDVKRIYHEEFDTALARYNSGKRADRVISDYLDHVSRSRNDVACEIIIQIGDRDFWEGKTLEEQKQMSYIFNQQLKNLEFLVPEFRIASAVVHYDESSPHMHVVGIPVAYGYKRGMEKQVAKTKIFTAERLSELQDKMRKNAAHDMQLPQNRNLFSGTELKEKEKGRNKDIPKQSLTEYYALRQDITAANKSIDEKLRRSSDIDQELSEKLRDSDQLDAVKKTKELAIQSLDDTITAKNNELADKERLVIYAELKVKALHKQEQSLNFRIPLKQSELKKLEDEVASLSQDVEKSQQRANRLGEIIANRESVIRQRNRILQEQDTQHKEFNQTISAQKKEMDRLYNQLDSVRFEISDSVHLAGKTRKEVADLNRQKESLQEELNHLAGEVEQKRQEDTELDRQKKGRQEELDQLVTKINGLKIQEHSLSPQVARMRSELAESKSLAGEVKQKRQEVAELDRQIEDRQEELLSMADIDEHEMKSILNDAITKNFISRIIMIVCKLLSEWGIIRTDWRMLAVKLTKPVHADLGESMDGFLQEVKEHRIKSIKSIAQKKRKTR